MPNINIPFLHFDDSEKEKGRSEKIAIYEKAVEEMTPEQLKKFATIGLMFGVLLIKGVIRRYADA